MLLKSDSGMMTVPYDDYLEMDMNLMFSVMAMAAGRKGLNAFDVGSGRFIRLTDEMQERRGHRITGPSKVCFLSNQRIVAFGDGKMVNFYDLYNRKLLSGMHMPDYIDDIAASRDGKYLAVVSGGQAQVWRMMYLLRWDRFDPKATELMDVCADIRCAAHPDKKPESMLVSYMAELQDRGLGNVPIDVALKALKSVRTRAGTPGSA